MAEGPNAEVCQWCYDAPGDALSGVSICSDCLDKHEIPPRMISGQMDKPVRITDGGTIEKRGERSGPEEDILDATCGGRSIWLPGAKDHDNTLYIDKREREPGFLDKPGRTYSIDPDEVQDFRDLPYNDGSFDIIVFDPPHVKRPNGMEDLKGYLTKTYGALHAETWQEDLKAGFDELWRVLRSGGALVFKFSDEAADWKDILDLCPQQPLFGTTTAKKETTENRWFVFYKERPAETATEQEGSQ